MTIKQMAPLVAILILLSLVPLAFAETQAREIAAQCTYVSKTKFSPGALYDGKYTTRWFTRTMQNPFLTVNLPQGETAYGVYLCFGKMPSLWEVQIPRDDGWETVFQGDSMSYLHILVDLPGVSSFRIYVPSDKKTTLLLNQLYVFTQGEIPDWVQRWEPTPAKADLLILAAHPDDDLLFMGGTIPVYGVEKDLDVTVAFMTVSNTTRSSELLNGLWSMGYRHYPVLGGFGDTYSYTLTEAYKNWDQKRVRQFVMALIRRYKPEVVVTHDPNGEYGHGAHMVCADMMGFCVRNGDNKIIEPELYDLYGGWVPKKLYYHLSKQNPITLDWRIPLASMGGKTPLELAQEAYALHVTQRDTKFKVTDEGPYSCSLFGLAYTSVGVDLAGGDFMENIEGKGKITQHPSPIPKLAPAPDPSVKVEHPAWSADWPAEAGERNGKGFLKSGEFVIESAQDGLWFYASPTLIVRIDRMADQEKRKTWYEAHIYCDLASGERVHSVLYTPDTPGKIKVQAEKIAGENQVVFGMNTDYYTYRAPSKRAVGIIIRNKQTLWDMPATRNRARFPNLDTLAMFEDGLWGVFYSDEYTASEYLEMGAVDVFSFGPYLVRDGQLNPFVKKMHDQKSTQPRCALGYFEPGHYYAMLEEGRIPEDARGISLPDLQMHMYEKGCLHAINMDGGQTAVFTFMGKQITRIGVYTTKYGENPPRPTSELVGVGYSPLVDPLGK